MKRVSLRHQRYGIMNGDGVYRKPKKVCPKCRSVAIRRRSRFGDYCCNRCKKDFETPRMVE